MAAPDLSDFEDSERDKRVISDLKRERDAARAELAKLQTKCDLLTAIDASASTEVPSWLVRSHKASDHHGIANLLLSDLHFDEVTPPAAVGGANAYNRKIALQRLQRTCDKFLNVARNHITGISYDGACVWLNGDVFSGVIHEELKRTNEAPIMASFDYWLDPMIAALRMIVDDMGSLHVVGRVGNHGRENREKVYKGAVEDNWDWLFYRILHRELSGDKRVTWDLPLSVDGIVQQYGTRYLATHGNQFRGGSGISGILTPLSLGHYRKTRRQLSVGDPYDVMIVGHFHQYMTIPGVIVNGSLKGLDEFAFEHNFGFEEPQQAFWITTPEHGPSFHVPIRPMDRKREGW